MKGRWWCLCVCVLLLLPYDWKCGAEEGSSAAPFVKVESTHFVKDGKPFYVNGFNAYWLMKTASEPGEREKVSQALRQAASSGTNVVRTWAFSDGGNWPLQSSPGSYSEDMFKGLDFVISEAKKNGVYLILCLVNNHNDFGGREQYVEWAIERGNSLTSDDDFFTNQLVKGFYKHHIKTVLTRNNTITGTVYRDDPTIFAWELINEPRCPNDLSGKSLQVWIEEMAAYLKSIDGNHLLEVGLEGFYGDSIAERKKINPGYEVGTDFISNHLHPAVDFATIHLYPEQWIPCSDTPDQLAFVHSWIQAHIQDASEILRKPLLITEFGRPWLQPSFSLRMRDVLYQIVYSDIYNSARSGGSCAGGLFWQLLVHGLDELRDGYEVILSESPSTAAIIYNQSRRLSALSQQLAFA